MTTSGNNPSPRKTAITGLSVVGFIALVTLGIWLATHSTRFVPQAVDGLSYAAVNLASIFASATASTTPSGIPD